MRRFSVCLFAAVLLLTPVALAQASGAAPASPAAGGFKTEFLDNLKGVSDKMVSLAEAIPAEKYSWRPGDGVMSFAEVCTHVIESNLNYLQRATGQKPSVTIDLQALKGTPDKATIIQALRDSTAAVQQGVGSLSDDQLNAKIGNQTRTVRAVLLSLVSHDHEHLGQSIAYARVNGVVPPWSVKK